MSLEVTQRLLALAEKNRREASVWIAELDPKSRRSLFIETCRVLDWEQVRRVFNPSDQHISYPDFDLMLRGWNATMAATLTPDYHSNGIPAQASNPYSQMLARSVLRHMGVSNLLQKTATMIKLGMATADVRSSGIRIKSDAVAQPEHFLDQLEVERLARLKDKLGTPSRLQKLTRERVEEEMRSLLFPWDSSMGRAVGYQTSPALDEHYMALMENTIQDWADSAGIHPETKLLNIPGWMLIGLTNTIASWNLKHMDFVEVGRRALQDVNVPVSLTIWKTRREMVEDLVAFTNEDASMVECLLDQLIVTPERTRWFASSPTPYVPLLIKVSDEQILRPVTSVFRNPLQGMRRLLESEHNKLVDVLRAPREDWMKSELDSLFSGDRYRTIRKPVMLKMNGNVLTDVDACVLDVTSGEVALFQLKWQDFGTQDVASQRSQGKNFVSDVDRWVEKVNAWVAEHGRGELMKALQFKQEAVTIRLFAVGRFAARFMTYGLPQPASELAVCTWPQLVRLRYEVGPVSNVLSKIHAAIQGQRDDAVRVLAMPHEVDACGEKIVFENNWLMYGEGE